MPKGDQRWPEGLGSPTDHDLGLCSERKVPRYLSQPESNKSENSGSKTNLQVGKCEAWSDRKISGNGVNRSKYRGMSRGIIRRMNQRMNQVSIQVMKNVSSEFMSEGMNQGIIRCMNNDGSRSRGKYLGNNRCILNQGKGQGMYRDMGNTLTKS
jgi:hypothetical protein